MDDHLLMDEKIEALIVTLFTGRVHHLIDFTGPRHPLDVPGRETTICGLRPFWPNKWIITDIDTLPPCGRCLTAWEAFSDR